MKGKIPLSEKYGLNPSMAICPECGEHNGEILLLGKALVSKCAHCGITSIGYAGKSGKCPKCGETLKRPSKRGLEVDGSSQRVLGNLCGPCREKQHKIDVACREEVQRGGVFFRCKKCGSEGAIKAGHPMSEAVREHSGIAEGPVVVELDTCFICEGR